jgi:hypothetical protein
VNSSKFSILALVCLGSLGQISRAQIPPNLALVGYWNFNEGSGNLAHDSSGNNNTGTLIGNPTWTTGKLGGGLEFNGKNYVTVPSSSSLTITGAFSITAWVNYNKSSDYQVIVGKDNYSDRLLLSSAYDQLLAQFGNNYFSTSSTLTPGTWVHVAYVTSSSGQVVYINGVQCSTNAFSGSNFATPGAVLMGMGVGNAYGLSGTLDEVRIFSQALTAAQVEAIYLYKGAGGTDPVINSFTATPATIDAGASSTLSWTTTGASTVSISPNVGATPTSGSVSVTPAATTTYTLTATDTAGWVTAQTTVTVTPNGPPPPVISSFTTNPSTIIAGQGSTLSWATTGATSVSISPSVGTIGASGSVVITPAATTTYTLTATGTGGTATAQTTITVTPLLLPPTISSFTATPNSVAPGGSATLAWVTVGATTVSIAPTVGTVAVSGSATVQPAATTTYTITATNLAASVTGTVTVTVTLPAPTITSFTATPSAIIPGGSSTLAWATTGATTVSIAPTVGAVGGFGSATVQPASTTTYTLTATNSAGTATATATVAVTGASGNGSCTTGTVIDNDCDGYGVSSPLGPDADDGDPTVNTPASMIAKYDPINQDPFVALQNFLPARKGYNPLHYIFIATNGNDSTCAINNINLPCATFPKASGLSVPGDAIVWRAGTYSQSSYMQGKGGTAANPMIYMAYPGEKAILSWTADSDGISMDGLNYWIIDGLVITQTTNLGSGIHWIQSYNVYGGTIANTETIGWYDGLFLQNGLNNLTIQGSAIHDSQGEHNVYVGCSNLTCPNLVVNGNLLYNTTGIHNLHLNGRFPNALVEGNTFYGAIGDCIALQMGVSGSLIQNNTCHTVVSAAIWLIDYWENSNPSIACYDQNYNVIRNNTFIDDGQSWNLTASGNDGSEPTYRVSDDCAQNPGSHDLGHNTFDSNIFVHWCTGNCPYGHGPVIMYDGTSGAGWLATDTWMNNIIWNEDSNVITVNGVGESWAYFTSPANVPLGSGNVNGSPLFVAANPAWADLPNNWNLSLISGSPAIGLSVPGNVPTTDILNKCRSNPSASGAYEYGPGGTCP